MDALFLRQVWAGNDALLETARARRPVRRPRGRGRRAALLPDQQGPVVAARSQLALRPRRAGQAGGGQLLSGRRDQGRGPEVDRRLDRRRQGGGDRLLHDHPPRSRRRASWPCPTRSSTRASSRRPRRCCARPRSSRPQPTLKAFLTSARRRVPLERLLRERRRLDGARRRDRADHRPVRGLRGRVVQLQGGVRGLHHRARRGRDEEAAGRSAAQLQELENALPIDPRSAIRSSARSRRSASSTSSSPPATATAACRPPPSTCPTTSASSRRRAPSA